MTVFLSYGKKCLVRKDERFPHIVLLYFYCRPRTATAPTDMSSEAPHDSNAGDEDDEDDEAGHVVVEKVVEKQKTAR